MLKDESAFQQRTNSGARSDVSGQISIAEAEELAFQHAVGNVDFYGPGFSAQGPHLEIVNRADAESYYEIRLAYRRRFR